MGVEISKVFFELIIVFFEEFDCGFIIMFFFILYGII